MDKIRSHEHIDQAQPRILQFRYVDSTCITFNRVHRHLCQEAMHELLVGNVRGAMPKKHQNLVFHLHTSIEFTRRYDRHVQCCIESDQARLCSYDSFIRGTIMGMG